MFEEEYTDPALKDFSRPAEYAKHVGKGVVGGAVKGALITGGALAVVGLLAVIAGGPFAWAAAAIPALTGVGVSTIGGLLFNGAMVGAGIGAVVGGGTSLLGAGEAVEEAEARHIANHERKELRAQRQQMMAQQYQAQAGAMEQQAQMMGLTPNLPPARGHGPQIG